MFLYAYVNYSLTPDQGFGAGLALAPFQSATERYSDEVQKVLVFRSICSSNFANLFPSQHR